jgi:hypothetical protein
LLVAVQVADLVEKVVLAQVAARAALFSRR